MKTTILGFNAHVVKAPDGITFSVIPNQTFGERGEYSNQLVSVTINIVAATPEDIEKGIDFFWLQNCFSFQRLMGKPVSAEDSNRALSLPPP